MAENLVTLREGAGSSLVFIHPASGLVTGFRRLVPHLVYDGAVFALENPAPESPPCSISELTASYWAQLACVAIEPLVLAGWSFGGALALELASLAQNTGRYVSAVVLLDAGAPQLLASSPSLPLLDLAGLFGISASELPASEAAPTTDAEILNVLVDVLRQTRGMSQIDVEDLRPFVAAYRWHHVVARRPWTFRGQRAPVFLLRARDESGWDDTSPDLGWSSVLGAPPTMLWTSGTHHSLMSQEHAPNLARLLSTLLARTQGVPCHNVRGEPS